MNLFSDIFSVIIFSVTQAFLSSSLVIICFIFVFLPIYRFSKNYPYLDYILNIPYFTPSVVGALSFIFISEKIGMREGNIWLLIAAQVFYYLPFVLRIFIHLLDSLPGNALKMLDLMNFSHYNIYRYVLPPIFRQELKATFGIVFIYCFKSFTLALILLTGSQYRTIEIDIFEKFRQNDLCSVIILAAVQTLINSLFFFLHSHSRSTEKTFKNHISTIYKPFARTQDYAAALIVAILFIFPSISIFQNVTSWSKLICFMKNYDILTPIVNSLKVGAITGFLSILIAFILLYKQENSDRDNSYFNWKETTYWLSHITLLVSPIVITALVYSPILAVFDNSFPFLVMSIVNTLCFFPNCWRILKSPYQVQRKKYIHLQQNLGISNIKRLFFIDLIELKKPIVYIISTCSLFSLGDIKFIFLGEKNINNLSSSIFQLILERNTDEAVLLAICLISLTFVLTAFPQFFLRNEKAGSRRFFFCRRDGADEKKSGGILLR